MSKVRSIVAQEIKRSKSPYHDRTDKQRKRQRTPDASSSDDDRHRPDGDRHRRDDDYYRQRGKRSRDDERPRTQDSKSEMPRSGERRSRVSRSDEKKSEVSRNSGRKSAEDSRPDESKEDTSNKKEDDAEKYLAAKRSKTSAEGDIMTRTGGAYIPPARLRMMQAQITDKSSAQYQRIAWEALKKSINGLINKINVSNLVQIVQELFQENIVRGRGLLARSVMQAQAASPTFTHVYAALVAVINTKFPNIGELILKRLVVNFKKGFRRNEKATCLSSLRFIAHLVNQFVCNEILALEILMLLVDQPTDDSIEVAVGFLKECGSALKDLTPKGLNAIFERLRVILHEAIIDKRVQYMIEVMFAIRKDGFKDHPSVISELDIVQEEDQFTHLLELEDDLSPEDALNIFKFDAEYLENEEKYKAIKKELLDEGSSDEEGGEDGDSGASNDDDDDEDDEQKDEDKEKTVIIDNTETNLVAFRRTLYLTIQSSLDFDECAHKILKMDMKPGQEDELCNMILDCCAQQRTYEKFFGLLAQRFCMLEKKYLLPYQRIFQEQYDTVHRLETNKLRNVGRFFAHLLHTDAISWEVLQCIKLNENDTTSSGRIFIRILFQELSEYMGLANLNGRLKDPTLQPYFEGLFPRDDPQKTRFAINFFTAIGLGGLTDELRDHLKTMSKQPKQSQTPLDSSSESSSESSSDESDSSSDSESDSKPSPVKGRRNRGKSPREKSKKKAKSSETPERSHKSKASEKSQKYKPGSLEKSKKLEKSHRPTEPSSMQRKLLELAYGEHTEASKKSQGHKEDRDKSRKLARDEGFEAESNAAETVNHRREGHEQTQHRDNSRRQKRHQEEVESGQLGDSDEEKTYRRSRKENIENHNRRHEGHGSGNDRTKDSSTGSEKRKKHEERERSEKRHRNERTEENYYKDNDTGDGAKRKERNDATHRHRNGADSPEERSRARQKRRHDDDDRNARREH